MIRKTEVHGDRTYIHFATNVRGGDTGIAVKVDGGYAYYDQQNISPTTGPALTGCYSNPVDAAVQGVLSTIRKFGVWPLSNGAAEQLAHDLVHAPYDPAPAPTCHYCGVSVDPQRATVGFFGEYQCRQCS